MTEDQLQAMENSAPLLVSLVRSLRAEAITDGQMIASLLADSATLRHKLHAETIALEEANKKLRTIHQAMEVLLGVAVGPSPGVRG